MDAGNFNNLALIATMPRKPSVSQNQSITKEASSLFLTTLGSVDIPGFITRARDGMLVGVNTAWTFLTGFSAEEAIGKTTTELGIWANPEERGLKMSHELLISNSFIVKTVGKNKSGQHFYVELTINVFLVDGISHIFGFATDGGGHSQLTDELLQKLHFYHELTTHSPAVLFHFKVDQNQPGHFTYMSKAVQTIAGIPPNAIVKDPSLAFKHVHPNDLEPMREAFRTSSHHLTTWSQDFRILKLNGSASWVHGEAIPRRNGDGSTTWYGSWIDISVQKKAVSDFELAQKAVLQKSRDLQITLDNMDQGILRIGADAAILTYNYRLLELLDISEGEMKSFRNAVELLDFQTQRNDFGIDYNLVSSEGQAVLRKRNPKITPDNYMRKTRDGRVLDVKNRQLADGSMVRTFTDITDFAEAQEELRISNGRFRHLTGLTSDWFWENDPLRRFTWVEGKTPHQGRLSDQSKYLGQTPWDSLAGLLSPEQIEAHLKKLDARLPFDDLEFELEDLAGKKQVYVIKGAPFFDAGEFKGYRGVGQCITEQRAQHALNQRLAYFDLLTNLPNRRLLTDRLERALSACARTNSLGALIFLDLDNFKGLNDTMGHDAGDLLLAEVALRLRRCVRESDTVCRFGGDEFVIILEHLGNEGVRAAEQATAVAKKIQTELSERYVIRDRPIFSSSSIGLTIFSDATASSEELLKQADLAMYKAKDSGRNTVRFFDPGMQTAVDERAQMETDLRLGLERGEFALYFQPIVSFKGKVSGFEALIRWNCPKRGLVRPDLFIPLAEQTGLIVPIGQWVLERVCSQLVAWQLDPATSHLTISMNVSALEFHRPQFVGNVIDTLESTGANANLLKLELTENLVVSNVEEAVSKMSALRHQGVRFSLDDFGTGNSSLSYLKKLPLDELKIDQSFVRELLTDQSDAAITGTIIALAHNLGLNVVAEGVETDDQRKFLIQRGCESLQGYAFGKPLPAAFVSFNSFEKAFQSIEKFKLKRAAIVST